MLSLTWYPKQHFETSESAFVTSFLSCLSRNPAPKQFNFHSSFDLFSTLYVTVVLEPDLLFRSQAYICQCCAKILSNRIGKLLFAPLNLQVFVQILPINLSQSSESPPEIQIQNQDRFFLFLPTTLVIELLTTKLSIAKIANIYSFECTPLPFI